MDPRTAKIIAEAHGRYLKDRLPKGYGFFLMIVPEPETTNWHTYVSNLPRKTSKRVMREFIYLDSQADPKLPVQVIFKRKAKP